MRTPIQTPMRAVLIVALCFLATIAHALSFDSLGDKDATAGLREALTQGVGKAVTVLGKTDGFLGNPQAKIPLPESLRKVESLMRKLGQGKYADELVNTMNRAAEAAVPEARTLLVNAVKQMSVQDAKAILTGGDDAATQYFRRTTAEPLAARFKPIVGKAMTKVKLADKYDEFAGKAAKLGLVKEQDAHLEDYVTQKALDGLFLMIAEEERAIRKDPVSAAGGLARKVFGLLK